jgi:hypothetical protein
VIERSGAASPRFTARMARGCLSTSRRVRGCGGDLAVPRLILNHVCILVENGELRVRIL